MKSRPSGALIAFGRAPGAQRTTKSSRNGFDAAPASNGSLPGFDTVAPVRGWRHVLTTRAVAKSFARPFAKSVDERKKKADLVHAVADGCACILDGAMQKTEQPIQRGAPRRAVMDGGKDQLATAPVHAHGRDIDGKPAAFAVRAELKRAWVMRNKGSLCPRVSSASRPIKAGVTQGWFLVSPGRISTPLPHALGRASLSRFAGRSRPHARQIAPGRQHR